MYHNNIKVNFTGTQSFHSLGKTSFLDLITSSVQTFQLMILIYRSGNFIILIGSEHEVFLCPFPKNYGLGAGGNF